MKRFTAKKSTIVKASEFPSFIELIRHIIGKFLGKEWFQMDDSLHANQKYLPGDIMVLKDGKKFRITDAKSFQGLHSWRTLNEALSEERFYLALLKNCLGGEPMKKTINRVGRGIRPSVLLGGKEFTGKTITIYNPLMRYLTYVLLNDINKWGKYDNGLVLLGFFDALWHLYESDNVEAQKIWEKIWDKNDSSSHCAEIIDFYKMSENGLKVRKLPESNQKTPDFQVSTSVGEIYLERKVILPKTNIEAEEVMAELHKLSAELSTKYKTPLSFGFRSKVPLKKSKLLSYKNAANELAKYLQSEESSSVKVISLDELEVFGMRFSQNTKENLPDGYGLKLEIPQVSLGLFSHHCHYGSGWILSDDRSISLAYSTCFDTPIENWIGTAIPSALESASDQCTMMGAGLIHISFPCDGSNKDEVETSLKEAFSLIRKWWVKKNIARSQLQGVFASFNSFEFLNDLNDPEKLEAVRIVRRTERLLKPDSLFSRMLDSELSAWGRAFPKIQARVFSLKPKDPQHQKSLEISV